MNKIIVLCVSLYLSMTAVAGSNSKNATEDKNFGGKFTANRVTSLGDVISNFQDYKSKTVAFQATTKKVCKKKGCWMVLEDGEYQVRTLFKDYGFFVPATILGKKVKVQGVMTQKKISAATIRHYMKDEGKSFEEIKKIKTGKTQFEFTADAVEII